MPLYIQAVMIQRNENKVFNFNMTSMEVLKMQQFEISV
jgi:hypothetical protein